MVNRYKLALASAFMTTGSYFTYDALVVFQSNITDDMNVSLAQYGLLFSFSSLPNIVLALIAGLIIANLGDRLSSLLFNVGIVGSSLVLAITTTVPFSIRYVVMVIAMFVFGLSSESLYIVQSTMLTNEIHKDKLALPMALSSALTRLGSFIAFITLVPVGYPAGFWYSFVLCLASFIVNLVYYFTPAKSTKKKSRWSISDLKQSFYLLMFVYVFGYNPIYVFKTYAVSLFALRDNISLEVSSWYVSIMELIPLVLTPLLGWWLINRERIVLMTNVAICLMVIGYTLSLVHTLTCIIVLGISLSLISASIWPYFSLTVKRKQQELAYGIVSSVSSLANVAMYPLAGYIVENDSGLLGITILNVGLGVSSISIALLMWLRGK